MKKIFLEIADEEAGKLAYQVYLRARQDYHERKRLMENTHVDPNSPVAPTAPTRGTVPTFPKPQPKSVPRPTPKRPGLNPFYDPDSYLYRMDKPLNTTKRAR